MSLIRLDEELLTPIEILPGTPKGVYTVAKEFAPQRASEWREACGVELIGGQLRDDDEIYQWDCKNPPCKPFARYAFSLLTTPPYPARAVESMASGVVIGNGLLIQWPLDAIELSCDITGGTLAPIVWEYVDWPTEAIELACDITGGELISLVVTYDDWPTEAIELSCDITGGELEQIVIDYPNWPTEAIELVCDITGGTLAVA